jgi:NAD(P)-dependent dehydrogenase (short-subunit alcohol dehydrogenase family)
MNFSGKVCVITGAASGIGRALWEALERQDASVIAADVAQPCTHVVDVTSAESMEQLARETVERHGRIDLWVNNAGIAVVGATDELSLADWRRVLGVNVSGVVHGVLAAYPRMVKQGFGHIVNVASVAGLAPYPLALPYTTSKHAVVGLSQALRAEARGRGVRVSVVCPGAIETPIWDRSDVRGSLALGRERALRWMPSGMSAERCADLVLIGIARNRGVIPVTSEAWASWWLNRLSPALAANLSGRLATAARKLAASAAS